MFKFTVIWIMILINFLNFVDGDVGVGVPRYKPETIHADGILPTSIRTHDDHLYSRFFTASRHAHTSQSQPQPQFFHSQFQVNTNNSGSNRRVPSSHQTQIQTKENTTDILENYLSTVRIKKKSPRRSTEHLTKSLTMTTLQTLPAEVAKTDQSREPTQNYVDNSSADGAENYSSKRKRNVSNTTDITAWSKNNFHKLSNSMNNKQIIPYTVSAKNKIDTKAVGESRTFGVLLMIPTVILELGAIVLLTIFSPFLGIGFLLLKVFAIFSMLFFF